MNLLLDIYFYDQWLFIVSLHYFFTFASKWFSLLFVISSLWFYSGKCFAYLPVKNAPPPPPKKKKIHLWVKFYLLVSVSSVVFCYFLISRPSDNLKMKTLALEDEVGKRCLISNFGVKPVQFSGGGGFNISG